MLLKSTILVLIAATMLCCKVSAQDFEQFKTYLHFSAGYGFKSFQDNIVDREFVNGGLTLYPVETINLQQVNTSFGAGFSLNAGYCYMINKNIGLDAGLTFLAGAKQTADVNILLGELKQSYQAQLIELTPSIVLAQDYNRFQVYTRLGLILATGSINYESHSNLPNGIIGGGPPTSTNDQNDVKWNFNGGLATGMRVAAGVSGNVTKKLAIFAEMNVSALTYAPTKGKVTSDQFNGKNAMDTMTTSQKQVNFKSTIDASNFGSSTAVGSQNANQDPNQPGEDLKRKYPFGSVGFMIGVRIKI
jgi:hypothetical protein